VKILTAAALVALAACTSTPEPKDNPLQSLEQAVALTVLEASKPVVLTDEGKSVTIQLVKVTDGILTTKLYSTGCTLQEGDKVLPPCETATNPRRFTWR
jgi:hypothetical protein